MRILLATLPFALLSTLFVHGSAQTVPRPAAMAYISQGRVLAETADGKAITSRMQGMQQQRAAELRIKQQAWEATRQQVAQASDNEARANLQKQELQQRGEFERATVQTQIDLQTAQRQAQAELHGKLKPILDDLAKSHDFQVVLNADTSLVWAAPGLDLTALAIERLNANAAAQKP
jgi:Skp family chaperone for outer membrane proteins